MRWIITLTSLLLLIVEAGMTIFILLIMLNGYPSLPDAMPKIFLACSGCLLLALSLLNGWLSKKVSPSIPMWIAGILMTTLSLIIIPIALFVLTFVLLGAFRML